MSMIQAVYEALQEVKGNEYSCLSIATDDAAEKDLDCFGRDSWQVIAKQSLRMAGAAQLSQARHIGDPL
ncbi:MAG: hypothetical protein FRX49_02326 [Trebouxia sp. A1-2]|nr:MAG: hypothetical protein FRX49_02326 [Trebouxia sp. A1-2]